MSAKTQALRGAVIFRRIGGRIIPIAKNIGIGAAAGYASGRIVSDALGAEHAGKRGAEIGAAVGAIASIPPKPAYKISKHFISTYFKGLRVLKK